MEIARNAKSQSVIALKCKREMLYYLTFDHIKWTTCLLKFKYNKYVYCM